MITCKLCGNKKVSLCRHLVLVHKTTAKEYKLQFPHTRVIPRDQSLHMSIRMKSSNPMRIPKFRKRARLGQLGMIPWNKGVTGYSTSYLGQHHTESAKRKMRRHHWSKSQPEKFRQLFIYSLLKCGRHPNKFEQRMEKFLSIKYPKRFTYVGTGNICLINGASPDFIDKKNKVVILCNGYHWHLRKNGLEVTSYNRRKRERIESKPFLKSGYKVWILWDNEWTLREVSLKNGRPKIITLDRKISPPKLITDNLRRPS